MEKEAHTLNDQSIYDEGGKKTQWRKDNLISGSGKTGQFHVKE